MERPKWLKGILNENDLDRIAASVAAAETKTSGEIVPMIVHRSITTGHVPVILFLVQVVLLWALVPFFHEWLPSVPLWGWEGLTVAIAALSGWLQRDVDLWDRLLTSRADRSASALRRAQLEFYQSEIKATEGNTGVLIFVSLLEHEAVILADQAVASQFPPETWENVIRELLVQIKAGRFTDGMCGAIETVGALLAEKFPLQANDRNELPNRLVVKE